jgi:hypothetical protein
MDPDIYQHESQKYIANNVNVRILQNINYKWKSQSISSTKNEEGATSQRVVGGKIRFSNQINLFSKSYS